MARKTVTYALLAFVLISVGFMLGQASERRAQHPATLSSRQTRPLPSQPKRLITVYYFMNSARCVSCKKIEAFTKEAVLTGFADAVRKGQVQWKMVNTDLPENSHFMKDYDLFTKSVVVVETDSGKQIRYKNLEKIWDLLNDQKAFANYIQTEVNAWLKGS